MFEIRTLTGQTYVNTYATTGGADSGKVRDLASEPEPRSSAELLQVTRF
jgi:hypothetical protein